MRSEIYLKLVSLRFSMTSLIHIQSSDNEKRAHHHNKGRAGGSAVRPGPRICRDGYGLSESLYAAFPEERHKISKHSGRNSCRSPSRYFQISQTSSVSHNVHTFSLMAFVSQASKVKYFHLSTRDIKPAIMKMQQLAVSDSVLRILNAMIKGQSEETEE